MNSLIKLFALSLLLSWGCTASSTTFHPLLPHPSSALLAADTLRSRGYSIFASLLVSITSTTNFSGTLLAPPDFAFSFASTKILNNHRTPPRPSLPVLLYHTLTPPLILTWPTISSRDDGDELRSSYNNFCLYLFKSSAAGEVSISSSPFKNPIATVKIRQPDLYVDENLTVHGIDGVLNPSFGTRCSVTYSDPTADAVPLQVNRVFLDHGMRALRRKGYHLVAAAMSIRRSDLLPLTSVTVLAVPDEHLFMTPGGFRYDFRHHVFPVRQRFADLAKMTSGRSEFFTLAPNKTVVVVSNGGAVTVDGVPMGMREIYHNHWIVVLSVMSSLDDVADSRRNPTTSGESALSPAPFSALFPSPPPIFEVSPKGNSPTVPSPPPAYIEESGNGNPSLAPEISDAPIGYDRLGAPSPTADLNKDNNAPTTTSPSSSPSPDPEFEYAETPVTPPAPSPATDEANFTECDPIAILNGVEGGDLLCPERHVRQLEETTPSSPDDVDAYQPFDALSQDPEDLTHFDRIRIAKHVNIADEVFFYTLFSPRGM